MVLIAPWHVEQERRYVFFLGSSHSCDDASLGGDVYACVAVCVCVHHLLLFIQATVQSTIYIDHVRRKAIIRFQVSDFFFPPLTHHLNGNQFNAQGDQYYLVC